MPDRREIILETSDSTAIRSDFGDYNPTIATGPGTTEFLIHHCDSIIVQDLIVELLANDLTALVALFLNVNPAFVVFKLERELTEDCCRKLQTLNQPSLTLLSRRLLDTKLPLTSDL